MDPTVKKLLRKRKLSAKDIGLLLIANSIDVYNGGGLPIAKISELANKIQTEKDYAEYELYRRIFIAIEEVRDLYVEKMEQAHIACTGLKLFDEAIFFANKDFPVCRWDKYKLGYMASETHSTGFRLSCKLRDCINTMMAIQEALKVAGTRLKIPGLEKILPSDKELRSDIENLNSLQEEAMSKFDKLPQYYAIAARSIFSTIQYEYFRPKQEEVMRAQNDLKVSTFESDIFEIIDRLRIGFYDSDDIPF